MSIGGEVRAAGGSATDAGGVACDAAFACAAQGHGQHWRSAKAGHHGSILRQGYLADTSAAAGARPTREKRVRCRRCIQRYLSPAGKARGTGLTTVDACRITADSANASAGGLDTELNRASRETGTASPSTATAKNKQKYSTQTGDKSTVVKPRHKAAHFPSARRLFDGNGGTRVVCGSPKARSNATFNPLLRGLISSRKGWPHGDLLAPDDQDGATGTAGFRNSPRFTSSLPAGAEKQQGEH